MKELPGDLGIEDEGFLLKEERKYIQHKGVARPNPEITML